MRGEDVVNAFFEIDGFGSPPHARGRHRNSDVNKNIQRITPACAGKTPQGFLGWVFQQGSPPHARGRRTRIAHRFSSTRITPACAGKTSNSLGRYRAYPDHPRMRGEDNLLREADNFNFGSPPHARGRQLDSRGNPAKSSFSLPVFFCSQPSPLGWFLRWVLGLGSSLWKQR